MRVSVSVCDLCRDVTRPTESYKVSGPGGSVTVDLCSEHAEPLNRFLNHSASVATPVKHTTTGRSQSSARTTQSPTTRRSGKFKVVTMQEIEERKRQEAAGQD